MGLDVPLLLPASMETEDATASRAANAVPDTAPARLAPLPDSTSTGVTVAVTPQGVVLATFHEDGPMGVRFSSSVLGIPLRLQEILRGSYAWTASVKQPALKPGLELVSVAGVAVGTRTYAQTLGLIKQTAMTRPLELGFGLGLGGSVDLPFKPRVHGSLNSSQLHGSLDARRSSQEPSRQLRTPRSLRPQLEPEPEREPEPEAEHLANRMSTKFLSQSKNVWPRWETVPLLPCGPACHFAEMAARTCCDGDHKRFSLRVGPNYKRNSRKEPSGPALFQFVGTALLHSGARVQHILDKHRPPWHDDLPPIPAGVDIPHYVAVNLQVPVGPAEMINPKRDGETLNIVFFWAIRASTVEALADMDRAHPSIRLLNDYCRSAPHDPKVRSRFKLIVYADPLPISILKGYNGKPSLLTNSASVYTGSVDGTSSQCRYLELDSNFRQVRTPKLRHVRVCTCVYVNKASSVYVCTYRLRPDKSDIGTLCVEQWNLFARKAVPSVWDSVASMDIELGVCIEAREDGQMPERLLGCAKVSCVPLTASDEFDCDVENGPPSQA